MKSKSHLLFFKGDGCPHCESMRVFCDRLEREYGHAIEEKEVWGDERNTRLYDNYRKEVSCDGLPLFVNTKTGVILCGEVSYHLLRRWAEGANVIQ